MAVLLDISGLEALFKLNYHALCVSSYRIVRDKEIASFIVQDVFAKLWAGREHLTLDGNVKDELYKKTIIQSLAYIGKFDNDVEITIVGDEEMNRDAQQFTLPEIKCSVEQAINTLPEPSRSIYILSRYEHLSYGRIARFLNINAFVVEANLSAALLKLRKLINQ